MPIPLANSRFCAQHQDISLQEDQGGAGFPPLLAVYPSDATVYRHPSGLRA